MCFHLNPDDGPSGRMILSTPIMPTVFSDRHGSTFPCRNLKKIKIFKNVRLSLVKGHALTFAIVRHTNTHKEIALTA